jgi:hypothetical protein
MPPLLCHCVFVSLHWASPDNLPCGLGFEYCGFLCKRIDASPLLCGRFLDDDKFATNHIATREPSRIEGMKAAMQLANDIDLIGGERAQGRLPFS